MISFQIAEYPVVTSTNDVLKQMLQAQNTPEGQVVWAHSQEQGRGQRGKVWTSTPGKNLTFSVLVKPKRLNASEGFLLLQAAAVGVAKAVETLLPQKAIKIKWPNDILVDSQKICGILMENLHQQKSFQSIIGIGLNVLETPLHLPNTTSLLMEDPNKNWVVESVLHHLLLYLEPYLSLVGSQGQSLDKQYQNALWELGEERLFQSLDKAKAWKGCITGVDHQGRLLVKPSEKNVASAFMHGDIQLLRS